MKKDHTSLRRLINEMAALSPSSIKIAGPLIEFNTGTRKLLYDFSDLKSQVMPHLQEIVNEGGSKEFIVTGHLIIHSDVSGKIKGAGVYPLQVQEIGSCFYRITMTVNIKTPDERSSDGIYGSITTNTQISLEFDSIRNSKNYKTDMKLHAPMRYYEDQGLPAQPGDLPAIHGEENLTWKGPGKKLSNDLQRSTLYITEPELLGGLLYTVEHSTHSLKVAVLRTIQPFEGNAD